MTGRLQALSLRDRLQHAKRLTLAIAAVLLAGVGLYLAAAFHDARTRHLGELATMARVLESETAGQLDGVRALFAAMSETYISHLHQAEGRAISRVLADAVASSRTVRSLSYLNPQGVVVASSVAANVGAQVSLEQLGIAFEAAPALGRFLHGRDLADISAPRESYSPGMLVMGQRLPDAHGYLVVVLNTDRLATQYRLLAGSLADHSALLTFQGLLLVAGAELTAEPGTDGSDIPPFQRFLPARESGQYVGPGLDGQQQLGAFRAVRGWPLVVVVQDAYATVWADWLQIFFATLGIASMLLLGLLLGCVLVMRDVRRQAAAQADIEASEALQQAILESALDAIVTIDSAGVIRQFNAAAQALFGYSREEAEGRLMHELIVPPRLRADHVNGMGRLLAGGHEKILRKRVEVDAMRRDGSTFPIEIAIVPVQAGSGPWFTSTIRDITKRRADEQAIVESENRFRATFEQAAVGMVQQGQDGRLLRINSTMCDMLGYGQQEFLALRPQDFIHPDSIEAGAQGLRELFCGIRTVWRQENRYLHKQGHWVWVRLTASLVREERGESYVSCVVEDVTAYRRTVDELDAARERELEIGARIQQLLLVVEPPASGLDQGLDFASFSQPSRGIDGDFYDVMELGNGVVDVVVGDVMGKGVPAALLGAATKMQFARSMSRLLAEGAPGTLPSPSAIVASVDEAIGAHFQALNAFVTLAYLRIDPEHDSVTWVGCGHEEPVLVKADRTFETLENQFPPIGVLTQQAYVQETRPFHRGDHLFLCSDGASDAQLPNGLRVGPERIREMACGALATYRTPALSLHAVRRQLDRLGARMTDDVTLLVIGRSAGQAGLRRLDLPISTTSVAPARAFVAQECAAAQLAPEQAGPFVVAVIEALTNVIRHARGLTPGAPLELSCSRRGEALVMQLRYFGACFSPPPVTRYKDLAGLPEGGFGLYIMQQASDRLEHDYLDGTNIVRLFASRAAAPA